MLENFGKKLGNLASTAAKKSSEMVEVTKLNMSISGEEDAIKNLYTEIGKLYYTNVTSGEEIDSSIKEMCEKIDDHKATISELKEKIVQVKNADNV